MGILSFFRDRRRRRAARADCIVIGHLALFGKSHGADFALKTGISSGDLYPALARLHEGGLIRREWEATTEEIRNGRPRRRFYEINPYHAIDKLVGSIMAEKKKS